MASQETAYLWQRAVLWLTGGFDSFGQPTISTPVEIACRWDNTVKQSRNAKGNPVVVTAEVSVKQDVAPGSILWLGTLADYYGVGSAGTNVALVEVISHAKVPDLKNRFHHWKLSCTTYGSSLPGGN